jgi:hypothetical protein
LAECLIAGQLPLDLLAGFGRLDLTSGGSSSRDEDSDKQRQMG